MLASDIGHLLDPDVRYGDRKPQYGAQPDPYWRPALHTAFMEPIGGQAPRIFCSRGFCGFGVLNATDEVIIYTRDGRALHLPNAGSMLHAVCSTNTNFWPNMIRGSFIIVFRALWASGSPPNSSITPGNIHNNTGGDWFCQPGHIFGGGIDFGWNNNGVDSRAHLASVSGQWASGDLVTMGFSYSPKGTQGYIKGRQVASTTTVPATWDRSNTTATRIAIGGDPSFPSSTSTSWRSDILSYTILDRELDAREWAWIHQNPLSWLYAPGVIGDMVPAVILAPPTTNLQAAVSMM